MLFKIGDIVQLKSGGMKMTVNLVNRYKDDYTIGCVWHDRYGQLQRDIYSPIVLNLV